MNRKLPPLNALKAFEAAARLMSFTKAAEELFVSPAAVSQQVKTLEEHLDLKLFNRSLKNIKLTEAGKLYYPKISEGFANFHQAGEKLASLAPGSKLTVSTFPSVASKWLAPKLFLWLDKHPEIEMKIIATHEEVDFESEDIDFRISYGKPDYKNCITSQLFVDQVFPVCSPKLIEEKPITSANDLLDHNLLHVNWGGDYQSLLTWQAWFTAAGVSNVKTLHGAEFNLSSMAIQAAIDGKGIMLGQKMMVAEDIAGGRLVRLFDYEFFLQEAYCIIYPEATLKKRYAADFLEWLSTLKQ